MMNDTLSYYEQLYRSGSLKKKKTARLIRSLKRGEDPRQNYTKV